MTLKYDVLIIGGGVVGCAVARELSRRRLRIILLEKSSDICAGQSRANTAIVHGGYDAEPGTLKAKYNVAGNAMFGRVCSELEVPYRRNGSLVVSFSESDDPKLGGLLARGEKNGVSGLSIIGAEEIRRREPHLSKAASKALLVESGGIVCPYGLTIAYAENAARNGVTFIRNAAVTGIKKWRDGWHISATAGDFTADAVVNCAGVHSDEINNMVSEEKFYIKPRRGEYYIVDKKYAGYFNSAIFQLPTKMGKGILVAPTVDGTLLIGPTAEDIDEREDTRTTRFGLDKVLAGASISWEDIPTRAFITSFAGVRAHCDRDDFIIGEAPDAELFFNAGGVESPGLTSAPAIGCYLAELIAERLSAAENPCFDPTRRAIPSFREMTNGERARAIAANPDYAKVVCRCENVTEAEIRQAIRRPVGARTTDGVKLRVRAGMGRCQAGFCTPRTIGILCEELGLDPLEASKSSGASRLLSHYLFEKEAKPHA